MVSSWMLFFFRNAKTAGPLASGCVLHISQMSLMKVCVCAFLNGTLYMMFDGKKHQKKHVSKTSNLGSPCFCWMPHRSHRDARPRAVSTAALRG